MVADGGVRGTDHAAHFGGVFAGKGFTGRVEAFMPCLHDARQ